MFRIPIYVYIALVISVTLWLVWGLTVPSQESSQEYRQLMEKARPAPKEIHEHHHLSSSQKHQQIQREIIWNNGEERLQALLSYDNSDFVFGHEGDRNEVIENMHRVSGYMQEELFYQLKDGREVVVQADHTWKLRNGDPYMLEANEEKDWKPMQLIRYFEAEKASYHYRADLFIAHEVKLTRFKAPGHLLITTLKGYHPLMQGVAKSIEFSLASKKPNFTATSLKASFVLGGN